MKAPKFEKGQKVKIKGSLPRDAGEITSVSYINDKWIYQFACKEVDFEKKEIIDGVKTVSEDEIEIFKEKVKADE